jgi:DNA-binding Lrp family transcriptional regulator
LHRHFVSSNRHFAGHSFHHQDRAVSQGAKGGMMQDIDATDQKILTILSQEARIPMKTLAGRVGLSRSATSERVTRLEKNGVIRGYRADIGLLDDAALQAFLMITLKRTPSISILDILAGLPAVRKVSSVSGQLDLVVEVEVASINALNEIRNRIAEIENVEDLTTSIVLRREILRDK